MQILKVCYKLKFMQKTRMYFYLCLGASFTRFQTMRLQKRFPTVLADQLISYGKNFDSYV